MAARKRVTIVVLGHVDHGKSTLIGRMLFEKGAVSAEEIERNATRGGRMGKASFKYAWVMDRGDESRRRGLTLDLNFADMETRHRDIHIIDAPGHRDFLRSMITGTTGADAALLVVDASEGIMPQTREHARLARLMGVGVVVVALNKIDRVGFDAGVIADAASDVRAMLEEHGFGSVDVIPVSAWEGQNLTERGPSMGWYKGRTLEEVFDHLEPRGAPEGGTFRMPVMQVMQIGGVGTVVLGRVERGEVAKGDEVMVSPVDKVGVAKSIEAYGKKLRRARAGETVGIALRGVARSDIARGDVLGPVDDSARLAEEFIARVVLFGDVGAVKAGWSPYVHCHSAAVPVRLEAIEMKYASDSGEAEGDENASFLQDGDAARVRFRPLKPLLIEPADVLPGMARFALRAGKKTVGAGSCVAVKVQEKAPAEIGGKKSPGFSYKHQKVGKAAREQKRRKEKAGRDVRGKTARKGT
jgi:elongation factor 1-alpha